MALIKGEVSVDKDGNWAINQTFDDSATLKEAALQRNEMDPYLDKQKRFRRLATIPIDMWNNPEKYPELAYALLAQKEGDYQTADRHLRKFLHDNPAFYTSHQG